MNIVIAGDYKGKGVVFDTKKGIAIQTTLLKRNEWIPLNKDTIAKTSVVFDEPIKSKRTLRLSVEFMDGKKSLVEMEEKFYKILQANCF